MPLRSYILVFCATFALGLVLSGCRQDMQNQPKFIPLRSSEFFPDRRSALYPVAGTVAQECPHGEGPTSPLCIDQAIDEAQLDPNSYFLSGRHGTTLGNELPDQVTQSAEGSDPQEKLRSILDRGRQRYNIYCTPCHSLIGDGNGMVVQRGYKQPPTFHSDRLRNAPLGHFYDVISNGFGAMPDYAAQIHPRDRWAIAAYIRALQRSQNAAAADLTPAENDQLKNASPEKLEMPDNSKKSEPPPGRPPAGGPIK